MLAGPDSLDIEPSLLTSAQAMADYALLIQSFKADHKAESSAVIAFGGSYGGMVRISDTDYSLYEQCQAKPSTHAVSVLASAMTDAASVM